MLKDYRLCIKKMLDALEEEYSEIKRAPKLESVQHAFIMAGITLQCLRLCASIKFHKHFLGNPYLVKVRSLLYAFVGNPYLVKARSLLYAFVENLPTEYDLLFYFPLHVFLSLFCLFVVFTKVFILFPFFILLCISSLFEAIHYYRRKEKKESHPLINAISIFFILFLSAFTFFGVIFIERIAPFWTGISILFFGVLWRANIFQFTRFLHLLNIVIFGILGYQISGAARSDALIPQLKNNPCATLKAPATYTRNIFTDTKEENVYFTAHSLMRQSGEKFNTVYKFSLSHNKVIKEFNYFFCPAGIYDDKRNVLFVVNHDTDELLMLSPDTLDILKKKPIADDPDDILMDKRRDRIIVLHEGGFITVYNPDTLRKIKFSMRGNVFLHGGITKGVLSQQHDSLFTANQFSPFILTRLNVQSLKVNGAKFLGLSSWGINLDKSENHVYITDFFLGQLYVLDVSTLKVIKSANLTSGIRPVEGDEKRGLVYVGNYFSPYLLILNSKLEVLKKVFVGYTRGLMLLRNGRLFAATSVGLVEVRVNRCLENPQAFKK